MSSTTEATLLDANVLIALTIADHEHHRAAADWLGATRRFATCPITQGALLRFVARVASTDHALDALGHLVAHPRHEFWPADEPFDRETLLGVRGYRQITDAYLASAAERHGSLVATFDRGLAQLRPDAVHLIAT